MFYITFKNLNQQNAKGLRMRLTISLLIVAVLLTSAGCRKKPKPEMESIEAPAKKTEKSTTTSSSQTGNSSQPQTPPAQNIKRNIVQRTGTSDKLRGIYRALELYSNDNNGNFPPAYTKSPDGKPLLSWRVLLLPYMEQDNLYRMFNQNEPWDGPTNKPLLKNIPKVYLSSSNYDVNAAFKTTILAPVAPETVFPPTGPINRNAVSDGLSGTILLVDADDEAAVEWTRPKDLLVTKQNPTLGIGSSHAGGVMALFGDGTPRIYPTQAPIMVWGRFTRAGGETPNP